MARGTNKLTSAAIERKAWKPGVYADGLGLYLQVAGTNDPKVVTKSWLFRYMRQGRARKMGLGPVHTVTLAKAREKALECRQLLHEGIDPLTSRAASRAALLLAAARNRSFKECALEYIADHEKSWKNAKHRAQWRSSLENYAYPILGKLPVADIDVDLVLEVIKPLWLGKPGKPETAIPETANRVRGRIETILGWATTRKLRTGDNPARWKGHIENLLPARKKGKHHAALPYVELPAFMAELRTMEGVSYLALEFTDSDCNPVE